MPAHIPALLSPIEVDIDDVLLDPNNPRFAELGQPDEQVPENRFAEPKVQQSAFDRMRDGRFDVVELRETIKNLGFLPMDRIVVRRLKGANAGKFVLIEGNRRVTALKWLIELHAAGKETFTAEQMANLTKLNALLLDETVPDDKIRWILPGLRHVSGIKEWGPYQKARAVFQLRESGMQVQEAAQSLGLSTRKANSLWRGYLALEQMKKDEEYGEHVKPNHYSYFEELFKRPSIVSTFQWSDVDRRFTNESGIKEFYSWMLGEVDETGDLLEPKLPEAKSIRELDQFWNDPKAMTVFRSSTGSLQSASQRFAADNPTEWRPAIDTAELVLSSMSTDNVRELTAEDLEALRALAKRLEQIQQDHEKLKA